MKRIIKNVSFTIITLLIVSGIISTASAAVYSNISAKTTRIASVKTKANSGCGAMQGLSVTASGTNKRLFVVKTNETENKAILYMYEDYTKMSNSDSDKYGMFVLDNLVGHANGMAIDDKYIYITCWDKNNDYDRGSTIVAISRSMLWSKYKKATSVNKGTLTEKSDGCVFLPAYYSNGNKFDRNITAITYYKDGKFIINYPIWKSDLTSGLFSNVKLVDEALPNDYFTFTTAHISDGKFIVSNSKNDVFAVDSDITGSTSQDIGYDKNCGFFIVRWLGGTKNSIIWIKLNSLSGQNRTYNAINSKFRIINVNKSSSIFNKYELESVSIGSNNKMYANVNTTVTNKTTYKQYKEDAIITIERPTKAGGSTNFLGNYFEK